MHLARQKWPDIRLRPAVMTMFIIHCCILIFLGWFPIGQLPANDKVCHFIAMFIFTLNFYWIIDISRRKAFQLTFIFCTVITSIGSEILQTFSPHRKFDFWDIPFNVLGSLLALALNSVYHSRMLTRRRAKIFRRNESMYLDAAHLEVGLHEEAPSFQKLLEKNDGKIAKAAVAELKSAANSVFSPHNI